MLTLLLLHLSRKYKEKTSSDRSPERVILHDPLGEVDRDRWPGFATPGKIGGHDNRQVAFFSSLNLVDFQRGLCHLCHLYHLLVVDMKSRTNLSLRKPLVRRLMSTA